MARILVLGAGLGGLSTAMLLSRDGHQVTVLERDPQAPPPPDRVDEAWQGWRRPSVHQFRRPHFMVPRWWLQLGAELPEAEETLLKAGARRFNILESLPPVRRGGLRPGDEQFDTVTARRPVLESALAAVAQSSGVTIRRGVGVTGLLAGVATVVPRVTGVRADDGGSIPADLVVDCTGRRSAISTWLAGIGARTPVEERATSGFVYYGRYFRGDVLPTSLGNVLQSHNSVGTLTLPSDNNTWSVVLTTSSRDRQLRVLREPERWQAAVARFPLIAHWAEAEPISDIDVFAGTEDRHRRFTVDGQPVVTGLVAVGDSWACTNPSLGRGAAIALYHGRVLRDVLRTTDLADHETFARAFDQATLRTVEPLYRMTVGYDNHRLAEIDADIAGTPYRTDDRAWLVGKAMAAASTADPEVARGYAEVSSLLATPPEVLARPGLLDRVLAHAGAPAYPLPGPSRAELLAALGS